MAGDLSHGREVTICGGGFGRRTEHDGAVRELRDQPQDRIQVADALYAAGTRRSVRSATGAASGAVGDLGATGGRVLGVRHAHPSWGPKKLRGKLLQRAAEQAWPAASTIGELLRRQGLSQQRKRRRHAVPNPGPLTVAASANDVWCIDFKGWFRTADHARCDPLTVSDAFSRYLLCTQGLAQPDHARCRAQLERVFREYGLPRVIRSDNGPPFASTGVGGLTRLGVWWIKLGITPERIAPGKPEQNGRHERMHKTLKAETATPPAANLASSNSASTASATSSTTSAPMKRWGRPRPPSTTRRRRAAIRPGSRVRSIRPITRCAVCATTARSNGPAS